MNKKMKYNTRDTKTGRFIKSEVITQDLISDDLISDYNYFVKRIQTFMQNCLNRFVFL
jgi:hypothetical protein